MAPILRKYFLSLSLRSHLLLVTAILTLPAIMLIIHFGLHERNEAIQKGIEETRNLAYGIATDQQNLTNAAQQLVTVLSQLPQVKQHNKDAVDKILADVLKLNPQFANIVITDKNGEVWASALPASIKFSLKNMRTYQNAMKTHRFSSGEYVVGKISTKQTIGFGYPIIDSKGSVEDVIALNINFQHFNELLRQTGLPAGTIFTIYDHNGIVIDSNQNPELTGKKAPEDILLKIVNGPVNESYIDPGMSGQKQIISFQKLRLKDEQFPYLSISVSIPLQSTLERADHELYHSVVLLSPFLLISIILTLFIGKYSFANRISKMEEAAKSFANGDFNIGISDYVAGGELGKLGRSLEEMAGKLDAREQELRKSEEEYRFLADNSADIIWRLGSDYRINYINPADEKLRGFTRDEVIGQPLANLMHPDNVSLLLERQSHRIAQENAGIKTGLSRYEMPLICKDGGTIWGEVLSSPIRDENGDIIGFHGVARDISERKKADEERETLITELTEALTNLKTMSGLLPICSSCKKIRDDKGYWNQVEIFISGHSDVLFSHSICPECAKKVYHELETDQQT